MALQETDVVVVGGGAAGLMAAGMAAARGLQVAVLERNRQLGRKLRITGKGRCNLTNACTVEEFIGQVPGNGRFLYSALTAFTPYDTMDFFEQQGLTLKVERGHRVFPVSDSAHDVADTLGRFARSQGCTIREGRAVRLLVEEGRCCGVQTQAGDRLTARAVIVCTGGLSYPRTGSTGDGYRLAQQAGHTLVPMRPSLVPLTCAESWCGELQGLSLRNCALQVWDTVRQTVIYDDFGELLFTHFGVSGPLILSASAHMRDMVPGRYVLRLDLKPALTPEQLDARLLREFTAHSNRDWHHMLESLLPRALCPVFAGCTGIAPATKCRDITRQQRRVIGALLRCFPLTVTGFRPIEEAVVTAGGVVVREVEAKTMASRKLPGLYFAGEVLDVDAYTGGYNLQIAFSTGAAAGRGVCLS